MAPSEDPTLALGSAWTRFQAQGGEACDPGLTLSLPDEAQTLAPAADSRGLGPAQIDSARLEVLRLDGAEPQFVSKSVLGRGGMGEVHLAYDRSLRREVALKTLPESTPSRRQALLQEALYTGYLEHPNVIPVHRLGVDGGGSPVLVMKRVVGTSWAELLSDPDHPRWAELPGDRLRANLRVLIQVCNAVAFAHSQGILHRDIKPANVMLGSFGEVYLVDWGLAIRLDQKEQIRGAVVGTLAYMAPEMLDEEGATLSERTDVYLLGATLHRVLVGAPRHTGDAHYNIMLSAYRSEPFAFGAEVPAELADLCNRACAADPQGRPDSAHALRAELERFLEHQGSVDLVARAEDRRRALVAEYAAPSGDERVAISLLAACRFGYEQALEVWPENEAAKAGLQAVLELAIDHELTQRNRGLAAALLAGLPRPNPALDERLRVLDAELAAQAEGQRELEDLKRDMSLDVGGSDRARTLWVLSVLGYLGLLAFASAVLSGLIEFSYAAATAFGGLVGLMMLTPLAMRLRWIMSNQVNRRLVWMAGGGWFACMLHLALCWTYELPTGVLFLYVAVIMTVVLIQMAAAVDHRLWGAVPIGIAGMFTHAAGFEIDPLVGHAVFGTLVMGYIAWTWSRRPLGQPEAGGEPPA